MLWACASCGGKCQVEGTTLERSCVMHTRREEPKWPFEQSKGSCGQGRDWVRTQAQEQEEEWQDQTTSSSQANFCEGGRGCFQGNNAKGDGVKKGNTTPSNKADDFNPSYVLWRASDGHVYAKFVGSSYEYIEWSIGVPKTLVTNIKEPITKWVPKTKHWFLVGVCFRWRIMVAR